MVNCGTVTVVEPQASLSITNCSLDQTSVDPSDTVRVTAQVENTGNADGEATVVWLAGGTQVDQSSIVVNAGESFGIDGSFVPGDNGFNSGDINIEVQLQSVTSQAAGGSSGLFR